MSRLPRRSSRVKPPLRGRAATKHYRGEFAPIASVRRPLSPYSSRPLPIPRKPVPPPYEEEQPKPPTPTPPPSIDDHSLFRDLLNFYKSWVRFVRDLNQPWQWLVTLAIVLSGLFLLSQLIQ